MPNLIGAHVAGGIDLSQALIDADNLQCECIQVFLSAPQSFRVGAGNAELDERFREEANRRALKTYVHGPYLMNFGSATESTRWSAGEVLLKTEHRARRIGASGIVVHAGSSGKEFSRETGLARLRESLLPILDQIEVPVLLEPMAGGGSTLAAQVDTLLPYWQAVERHDKLLFCLDMAHLLAAGEPLHEEGAGVRLLQRVNDEVGLDRVALIHANDSQFAHDSRRDRHANLHTGHVSPTLWPELFSVPHDASFIIETPGEHYVRDLEILRQARHQAHNS